MNTTDDASPIADALPIDDENQRPDPTGKAEPRVGIAIAGVSLVLIGSISMLDDGGVAAIAWWPPFAIGTVACAVGLGWRTLQRLT